MMTKHLICSSLLLLTANAVQAEGNPYDTAPVWSSDGKIIYFYSYRHGAAELYRMNADGSNQTRLTETDHNEWWPYTVPAERKVIVTSDRDSGGNFKGSNLYLFDLDTREMENLTNVPEGHWAARADIAMDANQMIYTVAENFSAPEQEIYIMELATGKKALYGDNPAHANTNPAITADGSKVAYASKRDGLVGLYLNDDSGKNERLFMTFEGSNPLVRFSPDGEWLAFTLSSTARVQLEGGTNIAERDIYLAKLDGSEIKRLTITPGSDHGASWSPDGKTITFASYRHGPSDIFAISPDGGHERNLTRTSIGHQGND